jgi:hypothetical protein
MVQSPHSRAIAIQGQYAYMADMGLGLLVYDVYNPARLEYAGMSEDLAKLLHGE